METILTGTLAFAVVYAMVAFKGQRAAPRAHPFAGDLGHIT